MTNPRPTELVRIAATVGATVEEDQGFRDMRVFQLCAPAGMVWKDTCGLHLRVDWGRGSGQQVAGYNRALLADVAARVACGVRLPTPEEAEICDL